MKHAVIETGGKQYLVKEGQELHIEKISGQKKLEFKPLLVFDDKSTKVGTPEVKGVKVVADVVDEEVKGDKIVVRKFKAKKRVNTKTGHRQRYTVIKISSIK